jgi:CTP synthase (UTP-ammonia lyase)
MNLCLKVIKKFIIANPDHSDFVLCEIGGTVGDFENIPFLFAIKSLPHSGRLQLSKIYFK